MNKYKIDSLWVYNFKVFDDFNLNFKKSNLISLGGPNGYGKTTIFDAIELALTGDIYRFFKVDKSGGSSDNIVAKDISKSVGIKIIMSKGKKTITFKRSFKPETKKNTNKIANFSKLWKLELIESDTTRQITQNELEKILEEKDLFRYYNNFFYIQQENTAHFLKQDEQARLNLIAQLFDLKKENDEFLKLKNLKMKIDIVKGNILSEKEMLTVGLITQKEKEKVEYKKILHSTDNINEPAWDKEQITFIENNTKDKYLYEVRKIKVLCENKSEIVRFYQVNYFRQNIENIEALIMLHNFQSSIDEILNIGNEKRTIKKVLDDLNKPDLLLDNNINLKILHDKIEFDFKTFYEDVKSMKLLKDSLSQSDKTLRELINFRDNLVVKFEESGLNKKDCPLCGHDWVGADKLITSLDSKKTFLNALLESETKNYNDKLALLKTKIQSLQTLII
ncbi:MAG: ATP-binding protein, partial [Arcobacteraceae bacterium]